MLRGMHVLMGWMFHDGTHPVWKLKKARYGLKQVAREWHKALAQLLSELGFDRCHGDPTLFVSKMRRYYIFLWVDDFLVFSQKQYLQPQVDEILGKFEG